MTLSRFGFRTPGVTAETYVNGERDIFATAQEDKQIIGGILAGGVGVIYTGMVLGVVTATGKWAPYNDSAVDGTQVARGILRHTTDTGTGTDSTDLLVEIIVPGGNVLYADMISGANANAIADLGAHNDAVTNRFRL